MGQPTFNQIGTRTRNDNGSESTATWRQNQGVNDTWNADGSTKYRIRFLVDEQNIKGWTGLTFNLYYNLASGGWNAVTGSSPIKYTTSSYYTDGDDCVSRLTGGVGTFLTDNNGMCTGDASATNTGAVNQFFELEFVLMVDPAQVSNGQTFQLRVYDGPSSLNSYTNEITITIYELTAVLSMANWRIREGVRWGYTEPGLNDDSGWAAALNTSVSRSLDKILRVRAEVEETAGGSFTGSFKWQYRYEAGTWTDITAPGYPISTSTPRVLFVPSAQYDEPAFTTNLLSGSAKSFVAGSGDESNPTASVSLNNQHTEFEGCFMIHKLFDTRGVTWDTDTIEFRLVQSDGTVLNSYPNGYPTITALMNDGLIGGVFSETVRFEGPICDGNGNLYSLAACSETGEYPIMLKSTDGGDTWVPQDVSNGPSTQDLESLDMVLDTNNNCIHIAQQPDPVYYHQFFVSTHGSTPDTWGTTDEAVDSASNGIEQCCTIAVRSDGDLVVAYTDTATNDKLYYRIKPSGGSWGSKLDLEVTASIEWSSVACVIGESDKTWFIYAGQDGTCWYKTLSSADSLSGRTQIQSTGVGSSDTLDRVPVIKPVYYDDSGTEHVFFFYKKNDPDNKIYCKVYTEGSGLGSELTVSDVGVISDEAAGRCPAAQAVVNPTTKGVYLVYADVSTYDIFIDENVNEGGWGTDTEVEDGRLVDLLSASLFTHNGGNGGATVAGIIYADGTYGYCGDIYYTEYDLGGEEPTPGVRRLHLLGVGH